MAEATARPWGRLDGMFAAAIRWPFVRRFGRDIRFTVPICIVLICGSFAATALLEMRLDKSHALAQAQRYEQARAASIARTTAATLDHYALMGAVFAASPEQYRSADLGRAEPAIRDIAVWDADGTQSARLDAAPARPLARPLLAGSRMVFPGELAFRDGSRTVAVVFDPASLMPGSERTALVPASQARGTNAPVPGWPAAVQTWMDGTDALEGWTGTLPLYLFIILGPALTGAWLAALLVGSFERQAKAVRAIRALKSTRPVEARLMVRLANAERGAMEALRSKSEFIAHMSHELRTPLNAVIGFSEIIAKGLFGPPGHPKYGEYARDIAEAGKSLHAKIGDILEFANVEAGRFPMKVEAVELAEAITASIEEHQGRAFSRRISLSLAFGEPGQVRADPRALRRILSNLLTNALTYTAEGGIVRADVHFEEGAGVLTLSDSGTGFSPREAQRLGKPFERFDRAGTVTGAGLGLAIAMELARRMGGAMQLAGESGRGAIMELRLPRL
ncbi:MAG TPA: HAMP domain-containing sensor histidine kinase [Rhizomicrobium sp.]|nr:HAMP domain-containing sensor histidine kinase [Rhizomicrobium sp.]